VKSFILQLPELLGPHKFHLLPLNSLAEGSSNHSPCPPSNHVVHHHTPASLSPFQAEAGRRAKPCQTPSPSLTLLPDCFSHLRGRGSGQWVSSTSKNPHCSPLHPYLGIPAPTTQGRERQEDCAGVEQSGSKTGLLQSVCPLEKLCLCEPVLMPALADLQELFWLEQRPHLSN